MSFGQIQFGGLASGLDTNAIIGAILAVESRPIQVFESRKSSAQQRISLIGTLEGLVKDLQEKARGLSSAGGFFDFAIDNADDSVASFTMSEGATEGAHTLVVNSLATASRFTFAAQADPDVTLGAGTMDFTYDGTAYSVDVTDAGSSLNGIRDAINAQAGDAVQASVVNVGTEQSPSYQLVVAGKDTGADFAISGLTSSVAGLGAQTELVAASNAEAVIDGLTVQRSSNVFSDVLPGVSFTVHQAGGASTSFNIDIDTEGTKAKVQGFVDSYNEVMGFLNQQSEFSEESGAGGALFGDRILRQVREEIQGAIFSASLADVLADTEGYSTLEIVGVELQNDGLLQINASVFDDKLAGNLDALADLFSDPDDGLMQRLEAAADALLDGPVDGDGNPFLAGGVSVPGIFEGRRDSLNTDIGRFDSEIARLERNLEALEGSLIARFANLEQIVGGLNAQSAFLNGGGAFPGL